VPITVRTAEYTRPADRAAIVELLSLYAQEPTGGSEPLTAEVQHTLIDHLAATPHGFVLLAGDKGRTVGLVTCFQVFSTFAARPLVNLHDVVVDPNARGQGVGWLLLEAVEAEARRRGCCGLTLEVFGDNEVAKRLYRKFGFTGAESCEPPHEMLFWKKRF
jgi:ribosomal protein S18 acetylase RimI-like enzyme